MKFIQKPVAVDIHEQSYNIFGIKLFIILK